VRFLRHRRRRVVGARQLQLYAGASGDHFWQVNLYAGYRFLQRRVELMLGLLNLADRDYQLNPLTLYQELPRARTLAVSGRFYF